MKKPDIDEYQDYGPLHEAFPIGMRVLVVDDDPLCLMILKRMLLQCKYQVTACSRAIEALQLLRERKSKFDLVISDVYMPDIDGFKLLELIGLEMDLPVIMMSANGETSVVMKGITHGACDYLLKPVRIEELRNIWQHVVRKRNMREAAKEESSGEYDDSERFPEYSSKKRKEKFESSSDEQIDDISGLKKPRVVWSGDLHRLFVKAVNQLGVEKAVPKRILEIMNVQGLTRENVASHLQKYRLGLKRLSGVDMEPHPIASFQADDSGNFGGSMCIRPGGSTKTSRSSQSGPGVFGRNFSQLDPGTLAALKQLQSMQRGSPSPSPSSVSSAQVLKGSRALKMRQTATSGIHKTASIDLGSLKVHGDWVPTAWQGNTNTVNPVIKEERMTADLSSPSPRSGSNSTVEEMDISAFTEPEKVSSPVTFGLDKVSSPVPFGLGKITEESTMVPQDLGDFCMESPDYFAVFQQQQNWSSDY